MRKRRKEGNDERVYEEKKCRKCKVDLFIGLNYTQLMYNNYNYICKKCDYGIVREASPDS